MQAALSALRSVTVQVLERGQTCQVAVREGCGERHVPGAPVKAVVLQPGAAPPDDGLHIPGLLHQRERPCSSTRAVTAGIACLLLLLKGPPLRFRACRRVC